MQDRDAEESAGRKRVSIGATGRASIEGRGLPSMSVTPNPLRSAFSWLALAQSVALVAVAGSFALTYALGLKPCPLCFYQRSFAMAVLAIVMLGRMLRVPSAAVTGMALAPAVAGLGVASYHVFLVHTRVLDCPPGLFSAGSAPDQSFVMFALIVALLLLAARAERLYSSVVVTSGVMGLLFALLSCTGNGPMNRTPAPKFDEQGQRILMICEPHWNETMGR